MTPERLMSRLNYPSETAQAVMDTLRVDVSQMAEEAYRGEAFPLCQSAPLLRLAVVTHLLSEKFRDYQQRGIPDQVIWDTFQDVPLRAELYHRRTGEIGISEDDVIWFRHIMNGGIFQIGPLQYQPFQMIYLDKETVGVDYMRYSQTQKKVLPPGSPVLNVHIPKGTDLSPGAVEASMEEAQKFFSIHFPRAAYRGFLCYSWLLYPPMVDHLAETSHIRQFAKRFSILSSCADPEQARENLISGESTLYKLSCETPEMLGFSCGVILF